MQYLFTLFLITTSMLIAKSIDDHQIKELLPEFEALVNQGMKQSNVPGVAIAIVYNNKVIFLKGFGFRDLLKKQKVTPDTVFQLASVSKPLASTVLASLVGQKKIQWDSKISNFDPSFSLSAPWVSANLTVRDLLSHRSGLPDHAGDLLEDLGFDLKTILHRLRFIQLEPFRAHYAYTNFGFSEAAYAVSHFLGIPWNQLAKESLYRPIGMSSTSSSFQDYLNHPQRATTYLINGQKAEPLSVPREPDAQSPAGGVSSSARDMAKWMILQLSGDQAIQQTHEPIILTNVKEGGDPVFYGMGWNVSYEEGRRYLSHSGAFALGVRTQVALVPEEKLGIIILSNASPSALPEALSKTFFDLLFNGKVEKGLVEKYNQKWMEFEVDPQEHYTVENSTAALPLKSYTGKFYNDYYGDIYVEQKGQVLNLTIGSKSFPLRHLTRDVFVFTTEGENAVGETQVIYTLDEANQPRQLTIDYLNKFGLGVFNYE